MRITSRTRHSFFSLLAVALALPLAVPRTAEAQILKKLKDTAKAAAEEEALNQVDILVRDKVQCVFNDLECISGAADSGEEYVLTGPDGEVIVDDEGNPVSDPDRASEMMGGGGPADLSTIQTADAPGLGEADANYDFERGSRVLFEDDFTNDNLGDFPRRLNFHGGNWDIVEWNGARWLRSTGPRHAAVDIPLPEALPEQFTIEFDAYFAHGNQQLVVGTALPGANGRKDWVGIPGNAFQIGVDAPRTGVISPGGNGVESLGKTPEVGKGPTPIRIMVDGQYAKVYAGARRVANVPNAEFERTDRIFIANTYFADEQNPMLIGSIRIAAGGRDLYDVLAEEGRFTTYGILFDVSSSTIRPESAETIDEIGTMLQDHPELRIAIEGHTDSDGDDGYNLSLSRQRAQAVRARLIEAYGIDPDRLEAEGFGESAPVAGNDTVEGKQQNRRVELVRL